MATTHPHLHFDEIDSTHLYALREGERLTDGTAITANVQAAGKGRFDRQWISAPGDSLLLSLVLKPAIDADAATLITPVLSIAAVELLENFGLPALIRWPNDVLAGDRKIAGILAEASFAGSTLSFLVASIGLNVNQDDAALAAIDRPASSIFAETGKRHEPSALLDPLLARFDALYATFLAEGFAPLFARWRKKQMLAGKRIQLQVGVVTGFAADGSLELIDAAGQRHRFRTGEATVLSS
jgi:BirA family transcriptional regulator, biotin operon repressor / biotin---[acetyl-CoA-carboxylase] ligase